MGPSSLLSITTPSLNCPVLQSSVVVREKKRKCVVESQHKIVGEMVEVMFTVDWDKGDHVMKVEEDGLDALWSFEPLPRVFFVNSYSHKQFCLFLSG